MFGSGKLKELETQLTAMKSKLENAVKEKTDLHEQLKKAQERIAELEKQLAESEGAALQEKARQTIVEYEGLKELYAQKNRDLDAVRESTEESFAREAATKRHDLSEEIRINREENQALVSETVKTFAGSYQYYLDQVRGLMDALSQAARETGESLFAGETGNIKERFGAKILEHLQDNADTLKQGTGDLLLIGAEEAPEEAAEAEPAEEPVEQAEPDGTEEAGTAAPEAGEAVEEAAEEPAEQAEPDGTEEAGTAAPEAEEAVEEAAEEAGEAVEDAVEAAEAEAVEAVEAAKEMVEEGIPAGEA